MWSKYVRMQSRIFVLLYARNLSPVVLNTEGVKCKKHFFTNWSCSFLESKKPDQEIK